MTVPCTLVATAPEGGGVRVLLRGEHPSAGPWMHSGVVSPAWAMLLASSRLLLEVDGAWLQQTGRVRGK